MEADLKQVRHAVVVGKACVTSLDMAPILKHSKGGEKGEESKTYLCPCLRLSCVVRQADM